MRIELAPRFEYLRKIFTLLTCLVLLSFGLHAEGQVVFRIAPRDASLTSNGVALTKEPAANGAFSVNIPAGTFVIRAASPGYEPKIVFYPQWESGGNPPVIEIKLERDGGDFRLERMVAVSRRPKSVEFTPDGRFLVVAPLSGRRIDVLNSGDGSPAASLEIPGGYEKYTGYVESAFPPGRGELWVTQMYTDSIHVFSLLDFSWKRTISSGGIFPKVLCPHPDGRVFVSNWVSQTVAALDGETGARVGKYQAGGTPRGLALSADGLSLYVANFDFGTIEVVDTVTMKRRKTLFNGQDGLPAGGAKRHLAVDPVMNRLYASDMSRGSVFALDLATMKLLAEIKVGEKTNTIKVSPDGAWLFVSTRGPNNATDYERKGPEFGEFLVIDAKTLTIMERHWGGNQPTGLAVSPDGQKIAFTDFLDHRLEIYSRSDRPTRNYYGLFYANIDFERSKWRREGNTDYRGYLRP